MQASARLSFCARECAGVLYVRPILRECEASYGVNYCDFFKFPWGLIDVHVHPAQQSDLITSAHYVRQSGHENNSKVLIRHQHGCIKLPNLSLISTHHNGEFIKVLYLLLKPEIYSIYMYVCVTLSRFVVVSAHSDMSKSPRATAYLPTAHAYIEFCYEFTYFLGGNNILCQEPQKFLY